MSDTPRTDAETMRDEYDHVDTEFGAFAPSDTVSADFARQLERELAESNKIISDCLAVMPVGYIPSHTRENLPAMISDLTKELAEVTKRRDDFIAAIRTHKQTLPFTLDCSDTKLYETIEEVSND